MTSKISSAIVDTENVYDDLLATAQEAGVDPKNVDVKIRYIHTKYKIGDGELQEADDAKIFDDDTLFGDPTLEIKQSYEVEYYDKTFAHETHLPKIALGSNKNFTKIVARIYADENIAYSKDFSDALRNEINKKLIKYGFLVGIRNENMNKEISRISSILRVENKLSQDFVFDIARGVNSVAPIDDAMIYHYSEEDDNPERDNTMNKHFLKPVSADDVIIEYIKPKEGKIGRNLKGEILNVEVPKSDSKVEIEISDKIEKTEDDKSIKYIAKISGYVSEEGNKYDIKEELDVNEATIKTTGSIDAGIDSDVTINIREQDMLKDAVGAGIKIETSIVNIKGNVAQSASIIAKSVSIGGQTHAKSSVKADEAEISVLLGSLECKEGKIGRLEGGNVKAKSVFIDTVVGGKITAEEVHIKNLFSNSTIIAARLIEIGVCKGIGNRIVIDVTQIPSYEDKFTEFTAQKDELNDEIKDMLKNLEKKKVLINVNLNSVNLIKQKIEEINKMGAEPPVSFINKLKNFQTLVYDYNTLIKEFRAKKASLDSVKDSINDMQNIIFDAKIINHGSWKEANEISFKLIIPKRDIDYITHDDELAHIITLKRVETNGGKDLFQISRSNELQ